MVLTRRAMLGTGAIALIAACQQAAPTVAPILPAKQEGWTPILPASDLAVGPNRFLYAVLDERNRPILDAQVKLRFFDRVDQPTEAKTEADAVFRGQGLGDKGVYVARVDLATAGAWGVEAHVKRPDGAQRTLRTRFDVKAQSQTPAIGTAAVPSRQALLASAPDPRKICTAVPTCAFHDLTIADALAAKKPTLVLFATPGFCSSAVCGPGLETIQGLEPAYRGRVQFIHVEIYDDPNTQKTNATVNEWRLPSEPWVFMLDRDGKIADKLEGGLTDVELREGIQRIV